MKQASFSLTRTCSREQAKKILDTLLLRLKASPFNNPKYVPPKIKEPRKVRI